MSLFDNQIGFAEESTYGTRVVPTRFLEFDAESMKRRIERRTSSAMRKGVRVQRSDRQSAVQKGGGGEARFELANKGFGMLLKHAVGKAPALSQPAAGPDPTVWDQTFTLGDAAGLSLTTQVGRPKNDGTVQAFDYLGCKVPEWSIEQELDAYAKLSLSLDAREEKTDQSLAAASYPSAQTLFDDGMFTVTVNAVAFDSKRASLQASMGLLLERFFLGGGLKKQPIAGEKAPISGALMGEFENLTAYNLFVAGTIVPIVYKWEGATISNDKKFTLQITMPACRIDGETPETQQGILDAPTPFTVLYDGTAEPITILYRSTDTAV